MSTPGSNKLQGTLTLDTAAAEKALKQVQDYIQVTGTKLKELSAIKVDAGGNLTLDPDRLEKSTKNLGEYGEATKSASQELRGFYKEQRLQDRVTRDASQALIGFTVGMTALLSQTDDSNEGVKRFNESVLTAITTGQAAEFVFTSVGIAATRMGGTLGAVGGVLTRFAGPISIILGLAAGFISFLRTSNTESKKAAEEGLKKYDEMLDRIAGKMDNWTPETAKARQDALRGQLNETESRLKILQQLSDARARGEKEIVISEDEARKAGINVNELIRLKGKELDEQIKGLRDRARELASEMNSIPTFVSAKRPTLTKEDAEKDAKDRREKEKDHEKEMMAYADRQRMDAIKERADQYDADTKRRQDEEQIAQLRYQTGQITAATAISQLEALAKETIDTLELARIRKAIFDIQKAEQEDQARRTDAQLDQAQRVAALLERAFAKSGDTFITKLSQALQIAVNIAKVMNAANARKEGAGIMDYLEVGANIASYLAMFDTGGHTGMGDPKKIAGAVHYDEVVFENNITRRNRSQLLALRRQLQTGQDFSSAMYSAMGGLLPSTGMNMDAVLQELRDMRGLLSNLEPNVVVNVKNPISLSRALEIEMPAYERYRKQKHIDA